LSGYVNPVCYEAVLRRDADAMHSYCPVGEYNATDLILPGRNDWLVIVRKSVTAAVKCGNITQWIVLKGRMRVTLRDQCKLILRSMTSELRAMASQRFSEWVVVSMPIAVGRKAEQLQGNYLHAETLLTACVVGACCGVVIFGCVVSYLWKMCRAQNAQLTSTP
jgi:hypothetical protein